MTIYVFGNELVESDSLSLILTPLLQKQFPTVQFIIEDPNANFPPSRERNPIIIDCVQGLSSVLIIQIHDLVEMKKTPISPHDYDLLFHIHLLKKMNKIDSAYIIALPQYADREVALKETISIITTLLLRNEKHKTCTDQKPE